MYVKYFSDVKRRRTEHLRKKGNLQFTEEGHNVEVKVQMVSQARAKLVDNKVNGPSDTTIVSEIIKSLPMENIYTITRCFQ